MKQNLLLLILVFLLSGIYSAQALDAQDDTPKAGVEALEEKAKTDEIKLYPNPTSGYFQIRNDVSVESIRINNIVGKEVLRLKAEVNASYDISSLEKGMYIVRLLDKKGKSIKVLRLSKR